MRILLAVVAGVVLAAAGFAGGWISGRATDTSCHVLPAYTEVVRTGLPLDPNGGMGTASTRRS
jgi:hypothetical protein